MKEWNKWAFLFAICLGLAIFALGIFTGAWIKQQNTSTPTIVLTIPDIQTPYPAERAECAAPEGFEFEEKTSLTLDSIVHVVSTRDGVGIVFTSGVGSELLNPGDTFTYEIMGRGISIFLDCQGYFWLHYDPEQYVPESRQEG